MKKLKFLACLLLAIGGWAPGKLIAADCYIEVVDIEETEQCGPCECRKRKVPEAYWVHPCVCTNTHTGPTVADTILSEVKSDFGRETVYHFTGMCGDTLVEAIGTEKVYYVPGANMSRNQDDPDTGGGIKCGPYCETMPGSGNCYSKDVYALILLGKSDYDTLAGALRIATNTPSPALATPACLELLGPAANVDEVRDNENTNILRQILAPECLADIVVNSDYQYAVKFYAPADVDQDLDSNDYYQVKAGSEPFTTWTIENPAASTGNCDTLRITIAGGGTNIVNEYTYQGGTNETYGWQLSSGNGLRVETQENTTNGADRIETRNLNISPGVKRINRETWRDTGFGKVMVERIVDLEDLALTYTAAYNTNALQSGSYGQIASEVFADGDWRRYEYNSSGRLTTMIYAWNDAAPDADADDAACEEYSYDAVSGADAEAIEDYFKPRTTVTKIGGIVVAKTFNVYVREEDGDWQEIEERCTVASSAYGAESNLKTTRIYNAEDENSAASERLQSVTWPDYRTDTYSYEYGIYTPNANPSLCAFAANATGEYVRVSCIHGATAYKSTKDVTIENSAGRLVMRETYVNTGDDSYTRVAWTVNTLDDIARPTDVWTSDGAHSEATWSCCGKESEKDGNGVEYNYDYDALHRMTTKTKQAATPIVTTYNYNTDGRKLTETVTAGGLSLVASNSYDLAGRRTKSTDFAGLVTDYAYANSGRTVTQILPGGYTNVTERYKDGRIKSITGGARIPQYYTYGVAAGGARWTKVCSATADSAVWVQTTSDLLGRTWKIEKPGYSGTETTENTYNNSGQLTKTTASGQADTLYEYDALGNQTRSGLDVNGNGLVLASADRITDSDTSYNQISSIWYLESVSRIYATDGSDVPTTTSLTRQKLTGLSSGERSVISTFDSLGKETVTTTTVDPDTKTVTQTTDVPDSSNDVVSVTVNGLLQSSSTAHGSLLTYAYDTLGRRTGATDPRLGAFTTCYDTHGWVDYVEDPESRRTSYTYESATGRRLSQTDPLNNTSYSSYNSHGQVEKTWGSATYPVLYSYDSYGRMTGMNTYRGGSGWSGDTWPGDPGTADTTTWAYHEGSGLLTSKQDAASKSVTYTYATGGRLLTRTWARADGTNALVTSYTYSDAGDLIGLDYSDSTPDVTFTTDRLGRQLTAESSVSSHEFTYNGLLLDTERIVRDGVTNTITRNYDEFGRSTGFTLGGDYSVTYGYNALGRFSSVSSSVASVNSVANYSYLPNSDLISTLTSDLGPLTSTRSYEDHRNLLTQVKNTVDSTTLSQYDYANDAGGRRTSVKHSGAAFDAGAAFNLYGYNSRSEVLSGDRYWGTDIGDTGDPVTGQSFAYAYDNIGNRTTSSRGAEEMSYTANNLNQYTERTIPDGLDVLGTAETNSTVTVNNSATTRHGKYWYKALGVTNDSAAVWQGISVVGVYNPPGTTDPDIVTTETGAVFVAQTPEPFTYDDDGNLTGDGRFAYTWDPENRLITATTLTNLPASVPRIKVDFTYDYMSRRVAKTVSSWDGSNWVGQATNQFVYAGWHLIRESRSGAPAACTNWYVWGLDLSGSLSGAGGIGGLLAANLGTNSVVYSYDANGNVSELLDSTGAVAAHYEYSPFGETIVATGLLAKENTFRFSTKYFVDELGIGDWGMRWYGPSWARWLSKDPLSEIARFYLFYKSSTEDLSLQLTIEDEPSTIPTSVIDFVMGYGIDIPQYILGQYFNEYGFCLNDSNLYIDTDGQGVLIIIVGGVVGLFGGCAFSVMIWQLIHPEEEVEKLPEDQEFPGEQITTITSPEEFRRRQEEECLKRNIQGKKQPPKRNQNNQNTIPRRCPPAKRCK